MTLVWVGFDDNAPTGLTGASGALPIWVDYMKQIGLGNSQDPFVLPPGIVFEDIDPENGQVATGSCPTKVKLAFREGTIPPETCNLH